MASTLAWQRCFSAVTKPRSLVSRSFHQPNWPEKVDTELLHEREVVALASIMAGLLHLVDAPGRAVGKGD